MPKLDKTTFTVDLTYNTAWRLQDKFKPGPYIPDPNVPKELQRFGHILREKINGAILQFENSFIENNPLFGPVSNLKIVPIELNRYEGWILEQGLQYDGHAGACTGLLLQVFRGLNELGPDPTLDF